MGKDNAYEIERSKGILKRVFLPHALLHTRRRIAQRLSAEKLLGVKKPDAHVLRNCPLFAHWPTESVARMLAGSWLQFYKAESVAALAGEPRGTVCVYWVMSGKLTQLPTKKETVRCAADALGPSYGMGKVAATGPAVFPSLFRSQADPSDPARPQQRSQMRSTPPLSQQQEAVLDCLVIYSAAQLVNGDALVLGDLRQRSVRCQTDTVLLTIPLTTLLAELRLLKHHVMHTSITVAKEGIVTLLAKGEGRPSTNSILSCNPALEGLSSVALKEVWGQLKPSVFCAGECICEDIFTTDTVYFLSRGRIKYVSQDGSRRTMEQREGSGIGTCAFVPTELPNTLGGSRAAHASAYCEVWGAPPRVFSAACDVRDEVGCTKRATALVQQRLNSSSLNVAAALAQIPAFLGLSEINLNTLARTMRLRVHLPGSTIAASAREMPVKEGVLVLCGRSVAVTQARRYKDSAGVKRSETVPHNPGVPAFFCEALLSKPVFVKLQAETGVVALHASPGIMMDAMESLNEVELQSVIDAANEYIVRKYGPQYGLHDKTPQEQAAERVKEHAARAQAEARAEREQAQAHTKDRGAEIYVDKEKVAENNLLTSLALQLQSLHHNESAMRRHHFLHDTSGTSKTAVTNPSEQARVDGAETPNPGSCFTIDDQGNVVFLTDGVSDRRRSKPTPKPFPVIPDAPNRDLRDHLVEDVPAPPSPPPPVIPTPAALESQRAAPLHPSPPPYLGVRPPKPQKAPRAGQLHVPPELGFHHYQRAAQPRGRAGQARPSRLASLKTSVQAMKDEADGFNPQRELRRAMYRKKGGYAGF